MTGTNLAKAIADGLRTHQWYDNPAFPNLHEPSAHGTHEGYFTTDCMVCMKDVDRIAAVAAQVAAEVVDEWERTVDRLAEHVTDLTGQRNTLRIQLGRLQPPVAARLVESPEAAIDRAGAALEEINEVVSALSCPYYRGEGTCTTGCYTEPRCITDGPQNPAGLDGALLTLVLALDEMPNTDGIAGRVRAGLGSPAPRAQDEPAREEVRWAYRWLDADGNVHDEVDTRDNARETAEDRARRLARNRPPSVPAGQVVRYRVVTTEEVVATYPAEREG